MTSQVESLSVGYEDHASAGANAAANAIKRVGEEAQTTETRVARVSKTGEQLAKSFGDAERLAAKVAAATKQFRQALEDLDRSELSLADKEKLRANILAQQEQAVQRVTAQHERYLAGMRAMEAASDAQTAGMAAATAAAGSWAGALADIYAVAGSVTSGVNGTARALQAMNADFQAGRASFAEWTAAARGLEASLRGVSAAQKAINDSVGLSRQTANTATIGQTRYAVTGRGASNGTSLTFGDDGSAERLHDIEAAFAAADAEVEAYRVSLGLVDAAQRKYQAGLTELQAVIRRAGVDEAEATRLLTAYAAANDPAAKAAKTTAADNEKLAASYKAVMASIDPAVAAQQRYDRAVADLRAGAAAAGRSEEELASDIERLTAVLSPAAVATRKEEEGLRDLASTLDKNFRATDKLAQQQALLDKAYRDGIGTTRLSQAEYQTLSAALKEQHELATRSATSTKLAAHEMTNLTYQIQDAAVQLAGGQNPLLIMMQQGPQATGAVGGLTRAMALLVSPTTLVVLGITAVVGALALVSARAISISGQTRELNTTMRAYGTTAQATAAQLRDVGKALYEGGAGKDESFASAKVLASTRGISASMGRELAQLGSDMTAGLGGKVDDAVKDLTKLATEGYPAIVKLQEAIGILTPAEMAAVRTMSEHGRQAEALGIVLDALHRRFDGMRKDAMSPAAEAMHELGVQFDRLIEAAATSSIAIRVTVALSDGFKAMADFIQNPTLEGFGKIAKMGAYVASPGGTIIGSYIADRLFGEEDAAALQQRITDAKTRLDGLIADTTIDPVTLTQEVDRARADIATLEKRLDEVTKRAAGAKASTAAAAPSGPVPAHRAANDVSSETAAWIAQQAKGREYVDAQTHAVDRLSQSLQGNAVQRALATAALKAEDEISKERLEGLNAENIRIQRRREALLQLQVGIDDTNRAAAGEVAGNELLAQAYGRSTAAVRDAEIQAKALAEAARGTIEPYDAIVARLKAVDDAQRKVQAAQFDATLRQQTEDAKRLAEAWGKGAEAAHEAGLANEALAEARKRGLDPTQDAGQIKGIASGILARDTAQRAQDFAQMAAEQRRAVDLANAEYAMLGQSNAERAKAVAILQTTNTLRDKGVDLTDAGTQAYIRQQGELARVQSVLQDSAQQAANISQPITHAVEDMIVGVKKLGDAGKALIEDMKRVAARALITKPAETWLTGTLTKLMSGPIAPANDNTPKPANDPGALDRIVGSVTNGLGSSAANAMWVQVAGGAAALNMAPMAGSAPMPVAIADGGAIVDTIRSEARAQGVPEEVALAVAKIESNFRQTRADGSLLRSDAGAQGVMQLMPGTAQWLGVDASDTRDNVRGGIKYLAMLGRQFGGDWTMAAAAYNAGPTRVQQYMKGDRALPAETVTYIERFGATVKTVGTDVSSLGTRVGGVTKAQEDALQAQLDAANAAKSAAGSTQDLNASQSALVASVLGTATANDNAATTIEVQSRAISHIGENAISAADHLDDAADGAKALARASDSAGGTLVAGAQAVYSGFSNAISGIWNWVAGLFSSGSGQTAAGTASGSATTVAGAGNLLSSASNIISLGKSGYQLLQGGAGASWANAATSFAQSSIGGALGLSTSGQAAAAAAGAQSATAAGVMGVPGGVTAGTPVLTSAGSGLASAAGTIGAAMPYGVIGGFGGTMVGNATGSKALGALSGAAMGAGAAGLGASIWGMGAVGGPWGIVAAAAISAIMAALGTQKPTVGPTASADITINTGGKSATSGNYLTDNDGDPKAAQQLGSAFSAIFTAAASGGGTLAKNFGIGQTAAKGLYVAGSVPYKEFGKGDDALGNLLRYTLLEQGGLTSAGPNVLKAIQNTKATSYEDAAKDIGLGASIDAGITALSELDKTLGGVTHAAKLATAESLKPMLEELDRAKKLGIGDSYVGLATGQLKSYLEQLKNPVDYTTVEQSMATLTGQFQALREAAVQLDPALATTVDQIEAETRARVKKEAQTEARRLLNTASDHEFLNQIEDLGTTRDKNARNLAAAGVDISAAGDIFNAALTNLLTDLKPAELDLVTKTFGGDIGALAQALKTTGKAAVEAAANLRAYTADLNSRLQAAVGNDRGSGLLALDQQQAVELAQARSNGYDTSLLTLVQRAERGNKAFTLAQTDVLAWYDQEITARQTFISDLQEGALKVSQAAKQFSAARDALAISQDAPISPQERLDEAKRQWDVALQIVRSTTASDTDKDTARSTLISLGQTLTTLEKENSGGTARTLYDMVLGVERELGTVAPDSAAATAETQLKTAQDQLKELQKARTEAANVGQRQLGSLSDLKSVMDQSYAVWQAALTPLQRLTGTTSGTTPGTTQPTTVNSTRYAAPTAVQADWDSLSAGQQLAVTRQIGWQGGIDESLNIWLATTGGKASSFETAVTTIADKRRRLLAFSNADIETNFGGMSDIQAERARNPGFNLAQWFRDFGIDEVLTGSRHIPGFATGTLATPPGAIWVGERGPELLWQGGGAAIASSADSMRIAHAYDAVVANDRYPSSVTPITPPARPVVSDQREILAELRLLNETVRKIAAGQFEVEGDAQDQRDKLISALLKAIAGLKAELADLKPARAA
ncbi:hypothetical protein TSH100_04180 [Azospirillum sp. TSH100]|uniref:phage tail length tape measure family protein n=1 Tax=Azospirillum sp. TSH100 TaxID=652764 RepID=UPI000D60F8A7|nr:phage tail length tape measure family protein [Azospirillum sp. TSH100]PWC89842.1 hypothetical protein TSH100_04180 [Azospirillum sp. TSH100]QCG92320.1 hypothetical protein E6C72_31435 [Azospirillum sp. TSH100]